MYQGRYNIKFCKICNKIALSNDDYGGICKNCREFKIQEFIEKHHIKYDQTKYFLLKNARQNKYEIRQARIDHILYYCNDGEDTYYISLKGDKSSDYQRDISELYDSEDACLRGNSDFIKQKMANIAVKQVMEKLNKNIINSIDDDYIKQLIYDNTSDFKKVNIFSSCDNNVLDPTICNIIENCKKTIKIINNIDTHLKKLIGTDIQFVSKEGIINQQISICNSFVYSKLKNEPRYIINL